MQTLSPRRQSILNRVVDTHIETAQPVGSRAITELYQRLYQDSYSSATVRHEMGALEGLGYLTHPHTSAGRVPTDQGYRYYVDHSLEQPMVADESIEELESELEECDDFDFFADRTSQAVSEWTGQVAVFVLPVKSRQRRFKMIVRGASSLLEKPEFQDVAKLRPVMNAIDQKHEMRQWLLNRRETSVKVTIGDENQSGSFKECGVVSRSYGEGQYSGVFAIMGPRRMHYGKTISVLNRISHFIENYMEQRGDCW